MVLVSQSTWRILKKLYELRLENITFVLWGALGALVLTAITVVTVIRPLQVLRNWAERLSDSHGRVTGVFPVLRGRAEPATLSRSLHDLSARLLHWQGYTERFSQDLSHELKNPLASMSVSLDLLESPGLPVTAVGPAGHPGPEGAMDQGAVVAMMRRDLARMHRLISGLRELGRADAAVGPGHPATVEGPWDPGTFLRHRSEAWSLRHPGLSWNLDLAPVPCPAMGHDLWGQVFDILADNAVDFHDLSRPLDLRLWLDGGQVCLAIRDHGPGIPSQDLHRVFDRFFSTRKHGNGLHTGLGLAIARALVEGAEGTIAVENAAPGARFTVRVPC